MVDLNPRIRPECSKILSNYAWAISNNEIGNFKLNSQMYDYPDHFFKTYFKEKITLLKSKH